MTPLFNELLAHCKYKSVWLSHVAVLFRYWGSYFSTRWPIFPFNFWKSDVCELYMSTELPMAPPIFPSYSQIQRVRLIGDRRRRPGDSPPGRCHVAGILFLRWFSYDAPVFWKRVMDQLSRTHHFLPGFRAFVLGLATIVLKYISFIDGENPVPSNFIKVELVKPIFIH